MKHRIGFGLIAMLVLANLFMAKEVRAHNLWDMHWHKGGTNIVIRQWTTAANINAAVGARNDAWNKISLLYNYETASHTDVSVFDGYYAANWAGYASFESYSGNHILHGHARYNRNYGDQNWAGSWVQGIFCQEVFHTYGFDHSATGDCMGLSYYAGSTHYLGPHNNTDFYNRYRWH